MTYEDFIAPFPVKKKTARGFMVVCPSHQDSPKRPSLSVSPATDGGVLLKCFSGCTSKSVVAALGLKMSDLFAKSRATTFTPPPCLSEPEATPVKPVIEKIYPYHDALGREVYQAIRLVPKSFRQRHRNPDWDVPLGEPVKGQEWLWTMEGITRVLYRLPQILKAKTVWIVEGEKDADNLVALGFEATCNVGGAGKWLESYSECLAGREVIICGDNDKPGQDHVQKVYESVSLVVRTVKVLKLGGVKDVSDHIAQFKTKEEARASLLSLVEEAAPHFKGHELPLYTIGELEAGYRQFVRSMGDNAFSLGKWLPTLGMKLRSLVPGELVFIIGDTGSAKTGVLQQIARASRPLPGVMFELELPREIMFERFASMSTKFTGEQIEQAYQETDDTQCDQLDIKLPNLVICPSSRITCQKMEEIINHAELKLGERPRIVLVDYIQLIQGQGQNRREKISDIAEELKVMAKATRTIIVCASQVRRPETADKKWEPSLHSAKESGSIESSCGKLIGIWKDGQDKGLLHLKVLKSSNGGTDTYVPCNFDGARMIITERSKFKEVPDLQSHHNNKPTTKTCHDNKMQDQCFPDRQIPPVQRR